MAAFPASAPKNMTKSDSIPATQLLSVIKSLLANFFWPLIHPLIASLSSLTQSKPLAQKSLDWLYSDEWQR